MIINDLYYAPAIVLGFKQTQRKYMISILTQLTVPVDTGS